MIHLFTGRQGSGKTLIAVSKAYDQYMKGMNIYSNVHLNFKYEPLDYDKIINCEYEDGIVLLDEGHQLLPSRNSMSLISREIVDGFLSMVRKKNLHLYITTQTERKIDIRVRDEKDYQYICRRYAFIRYNWIEIKHNQNLPYDTPVLIHADIIDCYSDEINRVTFNANPIYDLYDTRQIIRITGLDKAHMKERKRIRDGKKKK
jgi:hypothetical protein